MLQGIYQKNIKDCTVCKVEFDNWIATHDYSAEREELVRKNFCRYCPFCGTCNKKYKSSYLKVN